MCLVKRVQEVRCCFYTGHDGERIVNISSIATLRRSTRSVLVRFKSYVVLNNGTIPQGLLRSFEVLKKCRHKFDCLVYEMLYIRALKPNLNVQVLL